MAAIESCIITGIVYVMECGRKCVEVCETHRYACKWSNICCLICGLPGGRGGPTPVFFTVVIKSVNVLYYNFKP